MKKFPCVRIIGEVQDRVSGPFGSMISVIDLRSHKGAGLAEIVIAHAYDGVPCAITLRDTKPGSRPSHVMVAASEYIKWRYGWRIWCDDLAIFWRAVTGSSGSGAHRTENLTILARRITSVSTDNGRGTVEAH